MNVGQKINPILLDFDPVDDRRLLIGGELDLIKLNTSNADCEEVKTCIINTKNIIVKLDDFRTAQDHGVAEFAKGMFSVISGAAALVVLALVQLVCLPTLVIPGICLAKRDSIFLPGFSELASIVARGATRISNSFAEVEELQGKVNEKLVELNATLATLPEKRNAMNATKQSVQEIKNSIIEINQLQTEYGFKVIENMHTVIAGNFFRSDKIDAPYFQKLNAIDADDYTFVKLVKELSAVASSHIIDLDNYIKESLTISVELEAEDIIDVSNKTEVDANEVEGDEDEILSDEDLISVDDEFNSSFEIITEIHEKKVEDEFFVTSGNSES